MVTTRVQVDQVAITPATGDDLELLFSWRHLLSETEGVKPSSWETHVKWFNSPNHKEYMIWYGNHRVGTVGIRHDISRWWISIHIAEPELRSKGIATIACQLLLSVMKDRGQESCYAKVHIDNAPSVALFRGMGFISLPFFGNFFSNVDVQYKVCRKDL